jgi:hypothetical protein
MLVHSLSPSDSHDENCPNKMQSRVANGTTDLKKKKKKFKPASQV